MKCSHSIQRKGFTLLETVIAIGVLAVLLSGFLVVFAPAAAGIRKSLNSQDAARLVATLEQELTTLRGSAQVDEYATGFDKAFEYLKDSQGSDDGKALLIYKYRASLSTTRPDGTPDPVLSVDNQIPGQDYVVQNMMRRLDDNAFISDLPTIEGAVYLVKCTQLYMQDDAGELKLMPGAPGEIVNPSDESPAPNPDAYTQAVITFRADFFACPSKSPNYFTSDSFAEMFSNASKPVFSRNLAVRR